MKAFGGIYDGLPPNTTKPLRLSKSQSIRQRMDQDRQWVPAPIRALPETDRVEAVQTRQVDRPISAKRELAVAPFDRLLTLPPQPGSVAVINGWGIMPMPDQWFEISSEAYDHTTFMMPVPGGALIRHVEKSEDGEVAVSVCFVPNADGSSALTAKQFPFRG